MSLLRDEPYYVDLEIVNNECKCSERLEDEGISQFKIVDVRSTEPGVTRHFIRIPRQHRDHLKDSSMRVEREKGSSDSLLICFESIGCTVCNNILSRGSFLLSANNIDESRFIYSFISPNSEAYTKIISDLEENKLEPKILRVEKFQSLTGALTERQEKVLWIALKMGFYEFPRKIKTKELSEKLGISMSTFSEITRKGLRNLLESYFVEK